MSVEVLSPQNCLREPSTSRGLLSSPPPMKQNRSPNPTRPSRRKPQQQQQRKPVRSNNPSSSTSSSLVQKPLAAINMVNGPIKILQRGEELPKLLAAAAAPPPPAKENRSSPQKQKSVPDLGSAKRSGEKAQKQQKTRPEQPNPALWYYAGSITSPPPSSLPLPSFFKKKDEAASAILKAIGLNLSGL